MNSALFLDLGGTLLRVEHDQIYTTADGRVDILPNVVQRLSNVEQDLVLVVTNQAGIARGALTTSTVRSFINQLNQATGGIVNDYWACPRIDSPFRKPAPGMLVALADKHFVDLTRSVYVGDTEDDRQCAETAGVGRFVWAAEFFGWPPVQTD